MNFFDQQESARRSSNKLIFLFALAVVGTVAAINVGVGLILGKFETIFLPPKVMVGVTTITLAVILMASWGRRYTLRHGGEAVAALVGGRRIQPNTNDQDEKKFLNIIEEMAIASGIPVPGAFVLDEELGINAFAAGLQTQDAVVAVTRGCLQNLSRDELQGVVAHEFSHILNGDMRLNIELIGLLNGIVVIGSTGWWIVRNSRSRRSNKSGGQIILLGLMLGIIGSIGQFFGTWIKSAVSRQREFLADASAVQFTRNPNGIGSALMKIEVMGEKSYLTHQRTEELSHMFFSSALKSVWSSFFATHPSLSSRVDALKQMGFDLQSQAKNIAKVMDKMPPLKKAPSAEEVLGFAPVKKTVGNLASGFAVAPTQVHQIYVEKFVAQLPQELKVAFAEPSELESLLYAFMISLEGKEGRIVAGKYIQDCLTAEAYASYIKYSNLFDEIPLLERFSLLSLFAPSVKLISRLRRKEFLKKIEDLIMVDGRFTMSELAVLTYLYNLLMDPVEKVQALGPRKKLHAPELNAELRALFSAVAWAGTKDVSLARGSYQKAQIHMSLDLGDILLNEACKAQQIYRTLKKLNGLWPIEKKKLVEGLGMICSLDDKVTLEENAVLRATCYALDIPLPPILKN